MIIFIHNICMAFKGFGRRRKVEIVMRDNAAILLERNHTQATEIGTEVVLRAQLESYKICDIIEYSLPFLYG